MITAQDKLDIQKAIKETHAETFEGCKNVFFCKSALGGFLAWIVPSALVVVLALIGFGFSISSRATHLETLIDSHHNDFISAERDNSKQVHAIIDTVKKVIKEEK